MALVGLELPKDVEADTSDFIGSRILDSNVYDVTIETAYIGASSGGAKSLNISFKTTDDKILNQTIYLTSGLNKGQKTTYTDKRSNKERPLPGFTLGNNIVLATLNKSIGELTTAKKAMSIYNFEAKKEVLTPVDMLTELLGKPLQVGVIKQIVDKNIKDSQGKYVPSGEIREENEITKVFDKNGFTYAEINAKAEAPVFKESWLKTFKDSVRDRSTKKTTGAVVGTPSNTAPVTDAPDLFS